jgi:cyanate permease
MVDNSKRPGLIVLTVVLLLVTIALIFISVYARESLGTFASLLLMGVAIAIGPVIPALWRRKDNQRLK